MPITTAIRAAQAEPVTLVQSVSRFWHVMRDVVDGGKYALTSCHREVKVKRIDVCTVADIAHNRKPDPMRGLDYPKLCCMCGWTEATFGSAWETVADEVVRRAETGIFEADQRAMAEEWDVPVVKVESAIQYLTFSSYGRVRLRYKTVEGEERRGDNSYWGSYYPVR